MTASRDEECLILMFGDKIVDATPVSPAIFFHNAGEQFFEDLFSEEQFYEPTESKKRPIGLILLIIALVVFMFARRKI